MGNEYTDTERMTKLETQLENVVMVVTRMDAKMDTWQASFVSKELLEEKLKSRDEKLKQLEDSKSSYKNTLPLWVGAGFAALSLIISIWPHVK